MKNDEEGFYCPFCQRVIFPFQDEDDEISLDNVRIYVHDDVPHDSSFNYTKLH